MMNLDMEWRKHKEYLTYEYDGLLRRPKPDAPQYIKDSYEHYMQQKKEALRREKEEGIILV